MTTEVLPYSVLYIGTTEVLPYSVLYIGKVFCKVLNNKLSTLALCKLKVRMTIVESVWNVWVWLAGGGCG